MKRIIFMLVALAGLCQAGVREEALREWSEMKFGLFIHWGIYSIPAGMWNGEQIEKLGEQIQRHAKIPHDEYAALAGQFNPVHFDADAIVALAKKAGMRYIVLTAKHHDGFCMFASEHTDFDIVDPDARWIYLADTAISASSNIDQTLSGSDTGVTGQALYSKLKELKLKLFTVGILSFGFKRKDQYCLWRCGF